MEPDERDPWQEMSDNERAEYEAMNQVFIEENEARIQQDIMDMRQEQEQRRDYELCLWELEHFLIKVEYGLATADDAQMARNNINFIVGIKP